MSDLSNSTAKMLSNGGPKPVQFSVLGWEIPCETTAAQKVTFEPLIHTTAETIVYFLLTNIFASDASGIQTYATVVYS